MLTEEIKSKTEAAELLQLCREGAIGDADNGYNLWVITEVLQLAEVGLDELQTEQSEIDDFLVINLNHWLEEIMAGTRDIYRAWWDLAVISGYFMGEDALAPEIGEQLGLTTESMQELEHLVFVRLAEAELAACRASGPTERFLGLLDNLLNERVSYSELGTSAEEVAGYQKQFEESLKKKVE